MSIAEAKHPPSSATIAVPGTLLWRLLSMCLLFGVWEIAGRVPISIAFPSFIETMTALGQMTADGRLFTAYADTLKPLLIGVGISATFGVVFGITMGLSRGFQWLGEPIFVRLDDSDQNVDYLVIDTVDVSIIHDASGDSEIIRLTETGLNTGVFAGYIPSARAAAIPGDCVLQGTMNSTVRVSYVDPADGTDTAQASADLDPDPARTGLPLHRIGSRGR